MIFLFWQKDDRLAWVYVDGSQLLTHGECLPEELSSQKPYKEAQTKVYLLSNQSFYVRKVSLFEKKISQQKAQDILPMMLEDDFIDEVEAMQCFPLNIRKQDADVVIFSKKDWDHEVQFLEQANIQCDKILPAMALLPDWACLSMEGVALVRTPQVAFCAPWDRAKPILEQAVRQNSESVEMWVDTPDNWQAFPAKLIQTDEPWWSIIVQHLPSVEHDLSELIERESTQTHSESFVLYNLGFLVVILMVIGFGFKWHHLSQLKEQQQQIQAQIEQAYFKLYPDAKSVVAPKTRMERELGPASTQDDFLKLLGIVGQVRAKLNSIDVESISYESGVLRVFVKARDYEAISQLIEGINAKAQAKQNRTVQEEGLVKAQIEVMP